MTLPLFITTLATDWSKYYGDHQFVSLTIRYFHIAATVVGGGKAIALDGEVLKAMRGGPGDRRNVLASIESAHRTIVGMLVVLTATGALMAMADLDTFLGSTLFWVKIASFVALLGNGGVLVAAESAARRSDAFVWKRLMVVSITSLALWLVTVFIGTWLTVAA